MKKFVNPSELVAQIGLRPGYVVADFGCGAGFYCKPAAQAVGENGHVFAVDIMPERLAATMSSLISSGLRNASVIRADLEKPLTEIEVGSCDAVIVSSILHLVEKREAVIHNAFAILKTGGLLLVVEWKVESLSTIAPPPEKRIDQALLDKLVTAKAFRFERELMTDSEHYARLYTK